MPICFLASFLASSLAFSFTLVIVLSLFFISPPTVLVISLAVPELVLPPKAFCSASVPLAVRLLIWFLAIWVAKFFTTALASVLTCGFLKVPPTVATTGKLFIFFWFSGVSFANKPSASLPNI